jgi:succinate dehydrogenase / fumarate reductase iron-sulfur subunit
MSTAVLDDKPNVPEVIPTFTATLIIRRFDPEVDAEPHWQDFDVEMRGTDRILDALHKIKWEQDGSLTFRRSCAHGVCGSDAMRINGRNRLACKTLIKDLDISKPIYVEAIKGLPLEKDLIVNMDPFFESFKEVQPFLISSSKPDKERLQSPVERARFDDSARRAPRAARCSGPTDSTSARPRSSTPTASSSTRATRGLPFASISSTTRKACGAAARPSTAPRPAPAASR